MNTLRVAALFLGATLVGVSSLAGAHTEEYFDSRDSLHGGQVRMTGPYHLELVARDKEIVLYVADHADSKLSTDGGSGKATVQTGKDKTKTSIKLEHAGDNILKGTGDFSVTPETVITVFIALPGQEAYSARFTPLKPKARLGKKAKDINPQENSHDGHHHHNM